MKQLWISPTTIVNISSIDAVELSDVGAKVYVGNQVFDSMIPLATFAEVMGKAESAADDVRADVRQLASQSQFFGG